MLHPAWLSACATIQVSYSQLLNRLLFLMLKRSLRCYSLLQLLQMGKGRLQIYDQIVGFFDTT